MPLPPSRKRRHSPDNGTEGSGDGQNVKVVVRIRPPNSRESEGNFKIVVQAMDESVLVFDPKENCSSDYGGSRKRPRDLRKRQNRDLKFAFDYVFGPDATNEDVFNETTHVVLSGLLDGYNCSVFAYGATGAGKTHTMLGSKEHPGVMYHTMMDLYNRIDNMKDNKTCDVAMSYLEVYNETIRDLLLPGGSLPIREDPNTGVVVPGLSLHKPKTAEELLYMLQFGNQHRTQHPTDANAESSRSHAVLQVFVRQKDRTANISTEVRVAKLCLVDLAGSERATVTSNRGSRFREGANINRSLLALGNVINALAENKKKGFVPYRDSKLTRLLKDSLGGNCQTVMIAAVSPSAMSYEDTYNTLRYADRAKHIKATLKKNVLNVDFHVAKYGQIVQELRKEIVELKSKLKSYEEGKIISPNAAVLTDSSSSFIGYQRDLAQLFTLHQSVSCNQIQQEVSGRNLQWKIYRKERCLARIQAVDEPCNIESLKKVETMLNGMRQKSSCLDISSKASRSKLESSFKQLSDLEQQMKSAVGTDSNRLPDILSLSVQTHRLQSELENSRQYLAYTKQVIRCQEKELHHNERLLLKLLKLLKREHYIIKGHNMLTSDLQEEYTNIQQRVTGQELCWEDQSETTGYTRGYSLAYMLDLPALNVKSTMTMSGPSQIITNTDKSSVSTVTETERNMSQSTGQVAEVPAYPFKVDECSPPKAKRIMLTASKPQPSAGRVDHHGHSHEYRQTNKGRRTPAKTFPKSGRRRSHSESNVRYTNGVRNGQGDIPSGNVFSMPSRSLGENISSQKDKSSLVCEEVTNSKFSRLNDTITKSKKFSHLHVKRGTCSQSGNLQETGLDETFTLDSTFTIDPSQNCIPPSSIPCVDPVDPKKFCDSERSLSGVAVNSKSSNVCQKCAINSEQTEEQNLSQQSSSHANYLGISILSSSQSAKTGSTSCLNCSAVKQNHPLPVVGAQHYSSCITDQHMLQTGSQSNYGLQNDSGASTIVNQSNSSQTSLLSVSTLVDGQNLSQNLSDIEKSVIGTEGSFSNTHNDTVHHTGIDQSEGKISACDKVQYCCSATVTKVSSVVSESAPETTQVHPPGNEKSSKAVRSIKFDTIQNTKSVCTPNKVLSYADVVRTPTPDRKPLRQVATSNTPLSSDRSDGYGSLPTSESDSSFNKPYSHNSMPPARLFDVDQAEKENNSKILSKYGFPSLIEGSLFSNKRQLKKNQSFTPGYMQSTKAYSHRTKHSNYRNSSLNSNDGNKHDGQSNKMSIKSAFLSKNPRPLASHMRSKSTSNLSARSAWQF